MKNFFFKNSTWTKRVSYSLWASFIATCCSFILFSSSLTSFSFLFILSSNSFKMILFICFSSQRSQILTYSFIFSGFGLFFFPWSSQMQFPQKLLKNDILIFSLYQFFLMMSFNVLKDFEHIEQLGSFLNWSFPHNFLKIGSRSKLAKSSRQLCF